MPDAAYFCKSNAFITRKRKTHISVIAVKEGQFKSWLGKQAAAVKALAEQEGFKGKSGNILVVRDAKGAAEKIFAGFSSQVKLFDGAAACGAIDKAFSSDFIKGVSFGIEGLEGSELEAAHIGWGWAAYAFDRYKAEQKVFPALLWAKSVDKGAVSSAVDSVNGLRDLVNTPANLLGPVELERAARDLAKAHEAKIKVIKGEDLLKKNFPLIYTVGQASIEERESRLIELNWGKAKDPKLTLVGKGVVFDTGGLDLKPSQYMRLMKKDMGGAAHVLALAKLIMDAKLPVRLKMLIPAVENAVSGAAFRPGDIIKSRKGLYIENTNTDAEGRLILADALAYACEDEPDLVIDYATLTGSARAGLGPDIPAFFCNKDKVYSKIPKIAEAAEDPIWPMPLHQAYRKHIENSTGDLINSTGIPGDGIYSALFLESFIEKGVEWMHLDCFSWEQSGRPGRPVGAADTGLRTMFEYLKERYG